MLKFMGAAVILAATSIAGAAQAPGSASDIRDVIRRDAAPFSATCFLKGERSEGMNKICFYDCLGSPAAITIGAVELCPLTIER